MFDLNQWAAWAQILSVLVAIIAIWITFWIYRRSIPKREITCVFDTIISPIEIRAGETLDSKIEILYGGKYVDNLFIVRATLRNTGNTPIRESDVIEPIRFQFDSSVRLLRQPQILHKKPENLKAISNLSKNDHPNTAFLIFDLINQNEEITVEFICTGESKFPEVEARIEGISKIKTLSMDQQWWESLDEMVFLFIGLLFSFVVELATKFLSPEGIILVSLLILSVVGGYVLWKIGSR